MPILRLEQAKASLRNGELLVFPTETVFGIGCDPRNASAVEALLALKSRSDAAGMPVLISQAAVIEQIVDDPSDAHRRQRQELQAQHWPGALTIVVQPKAEVNVATGVAASDGSLALRYSSLAVAQELAEACGGLVIATSANYKGQAPATDAAQAARLFPELAVLQGQCVPAAKPSTIVDARVLPYRVIRQGAVELIEGLS